MILPLKKIHFIGIGGIGMSAIAEMLPPLGIIVQGSNDKENDNTRRLKEKGIKVFIGHNSVNVENVDAVVISTAIREDNIELVKAKELGIPVAHRSEILAELLKYKKGICVAGSHGKTTTSSLITHILNSAHYDPSYIIGGILNHQKSNAGVGKGDWLVAEADESDGSFLKLPRTISVVTNIDPEHLDFYKTYEREKLAFLSFLNQTLFYGCCVVCLDHPAVKELIPEIKGRKIITYGITEDADVTAKNIRVEGKNTIFDVHTKDKIIKDVSITIMGKHNVLNSLAAICVANFIGVDDTQIKNALNSFQGIQRRLTLRGTEKGISIYDDYAHHPTEIKATISALKEHILGRLVVVFQPHRYTRFRDLWEGFQESFKNADIVFVTDVYSAGDDIITSISSDRFVNELRQIQSQVYKVDENHFENDVLKVLKEGDTVLCLNAGSLSHKIPKLIDALKDKK